jgi:F-type H+-transporting ATPase subunit a
MAVIMTPVEAIAKLARIFALAIRLFANMTAGHLVILSLVGLIFVAGTSSIRWVVWPAPVLMTVAIMLMEIFIALLQAYIFAMLTSVFIGLVRHAH